MGFITALSTGRREGTATLPSADTKLLMPVTQSVLCSELSPTSPEDVQQVPGQMSGIYQLGDYKTATDSQVSVRKTRQSYRDCS